MKWHKDQTSTPGTPRPKQDANWHLRVMLLSGLIIPIVPTSQIFKAVSLLRDFSQKDCVILRHASLIFQKTYPIPEIPL